MDNSAFAAGLLQTGEKIVFFQDNQNHLRRAVYSDSAWTSLNELPQDIIGTVANNTPLSLFVQAGANITAVSQYCHIHLRLT